MVGGFADHDVADDGGQVGEAGVEGRYLQFGFVGGVTGLGGEYLHEFGEVVGEEVVTLLGGGDAAGHGGTGGGDGLGLFGAGAAAVTPDFGYVGFGVGQGLGNGAGGGQGGEEAGAEGFEGGEGGFAGVGGVVVRGFGDAEAVHGGLGFA